MRTTTHNMILRRALIALAAMAASLLMVLTTVALPVQGQSAPSGTTITVNTDNGPLINRTDGYCALREAIQAANTNKSVDTCPAGSSSDQDEIGFQLRDFRRYIAVYTSLLRLHAGQQLATRHQSQV